MRVSYSIVKRTKDLLVLRDEGPWDLYMTVTNAADSVVEELPATGVLNEGQRLLYYDSEGLLDEIVFENGEFVRFQPCLPGEGLR